jgi:pyruvate/2-oxoglutarate dehydrogenase complex dihydrolipoamide dehydrogenase (E3) component
MAQSLDVDICVIGAGAGGLVVAAASALLGAPVALVERGKMGGDCLNYGCVPSKSMIAAARMAALSRAAPAFGVDLAIPAIDYRRVHDHIQSVIAAIAPQDGQARFEGLGCTVIRAAASFISPDTLMAGEVRIRARRFVIATGSSPAIPPIDGLRDTPFLTNETIFDLEALPAHLIIIGGGAVGVELAQAQRRLGARVSLIEMFGILGRDDSEAVEVVRAALMRDGVELHERASVLQVERTSAGLTGVATGVAVTIGSGGTQRRIEGSHLLVATGRKPNVEGLGLEAAAVVYSSRGIQVDRRLRTTNKRIFALGDATGGSMLTHVSSYHAGIVIKNALFRLPAKTDERAIPHVVYTDPEFAHVGLTEEAARKTQRTIRILRWSFAENNRAQAERATLGFVKAIVTRRGRILGATIAGSHAGELILPWTLALARGLKIGALATLVAPYPNLSEVTKSTAGSFFTPSLFGDRTKRLVRFLRRFG